MTRTAGARRAGAPRLPAAARRLRRLLRLPLREQATTLHALLTLVVVEALLHRLRLPRLAALLGITLDVSTPATGRAGDRAGAGAPPARDGRRAGEVERAVRSTRRLVGVWPFGAGPCLRESLVLGHLLRHRAPLLRIGVAGEGERLVAHAWLEVDGQTLGESSGFTTFEGRPPRRSR